MPHHFRIDIFLSGNTSDDLFVHEIRVVLGHIVLVVDLGFT
jgi:hypothetical protein